MHGKFAVHRGTAVTVAGVLVCAVAAMGVVLAPLESFAATTHNATLIHVGPSGLQSYNAWSKKSTTLVSAMAGTWYFPVLSPNGVSVVTMKNNRTDRAYSSEIYGAVPASQTPAVELTIPRDDGSMGMSSFLGWLDDYQAVFQQDDPNNPDGDQATVVCDVRNPAAWSYYSGDVTYPSNWRKKTAWDVACGSYVSKKGVLTITRRKGKKRIARFKLPGFGGGKTIHKNWYTGWEYWASDGISVSPDEKFVAYELFSQPKYGQSYVAWRTYVCTIKGKSAKRIKNDNGGFVWK